MALNFDDIISRFEEQQNAANAKNEERYGQLLAAIESLGAQTTGTFQEALGEISTLGDAARTRVDQTATREKGRAEQDLISRGLGNTTIRESVRRGITDDQSLQHQGIDESVGQQRSGILQNLAGNQTQIGSMLAGAIEGRNDIGPDLSMLASLLQASASSDTSRVSVSVPNSPVSAPTGGGIFRGGGGGGAGGGNATNLQRNAGGGNPGTGASRVGPGADQRSDAIYKTPEQGGLVINAPENTGQQANAGGFLRYLSQNYSGA